MIRKTRLWLAVVLPSAASNRFTRAVTRLMTAGLVTVRRKKGNGNGGYGARYRLTKAGVDSVRF
jgi:hypothetical protein